jgi:exonuclease SbcD
MTLPTVLMAHLHVRGSNLNHNLFRMTDAEDILVDLADLSAGWAYVALGHIHQPMQVGGSETIRYPGPLDRLDFGEREDDRGVIIFDLERTGVRGVPTWHHLPPTPMHRISVTDPDQELATLTETYPDHESAIVQIEVHQPASCVLTRHQITLALRKIFPRCHMLTWIRQHDASTADQDSDQTDNRLSVSINRETRGFGETVRQYLQQKLEQHPARTEILALAERFLQSSQKESR